MNTKLYSRQWEVPSDTDSDKVYKVSLKHNGTYVCSCPHNIFRKVRCRHIEHVEEFEVRRKEAERAARAASQFGIACLA